MAYGNIDQAANSRQSSGGGVNSICMKHHFSLECPHCRLAQYLYRCGDEAGETKEKPGAFRKEAKSFYVAPLNYSFGLVSTVNPSKFNGTALSMVYWPKSIVDEILVNIQDPNPAGRWPDISALPSAKGVILRKLKKEGTEYAQYKSSLAQQDWTVDAAWFESMKPYMCDINNPVALMAAAESYQAAGALFTCFGDMKMGESATIRLLPVNTYPQNNLFPIGVVKTHWSSARTPWDAKWKEVGYDLKRYDEVMSDQMVNVFLSSVERRISGGAPAQAAGAYTAAGPQAASAVYQSMEDLPF